MKLDQPLHVKEIAQIIGAKVMGNDNLIISGLNEIHKITKGDLTFCDLEKYFPRCLSSDASAVIVNQEIQNLNGKAILICEDPFAAYEKLVKRYRKRRPHLSQIGEDCDIHPSVIIEHGVVIGHQVKIDADCYIQANTFIGDYTRIGKGVHIKPNTVIGTDAFYFKQYQDKLAKWTTAGRVIIHDDVYIGAGCTIDSGVSGDTVIGEGTKLDSQIHIGHGVVLGKHCLLAAQVGIGGKTIIGDRVKIFGQVGIAQNLVIEDDVTINAKSGINKNLEKGKTYFGIPALEVAEKYREIALIKMMSKKR